MAGRVSGFAAACLALGALLGPMSVGATAAVTVASSESARVAIDTCLKRLNPEIDIGYERISARCPDLARRIEASGWAVWLPRDWQRAGNDLSAGGLRQLAQLLGAGAAASASRRLNVVGLPAVLASLEAKSAAESGGWWGRTKAWLREVFERGEEEDDDWLSHFVGQNGFSQAVIELVSYVALALVVVLAVVIVVNELRVTGWLRRLWGRFVGRRRSDPRAPGAGVGVEGCAVAGRSWSLDDVEKADRAFQPRMLLELITWRLTEAGRLPQSRGLTVRELTRAALLSEEVDRERLADLARMAERVRFSDERVSNEALTSVLQGGRMLLERLSVGPVA